MDSIHATTEGAAPPPALRHDESESQIAQMLAANANVNVGGGGGGGSSSAEGDGYTLAAASSGGASALSVSILLDDHRRRESIALPSRSGAGASPAAAAGREGDDDDEEDARSSLASSVESEGLEAAEAELHKQAANRHARTATPARPGYDDGLADDLGEDGALLGVHLEERTAALEEAEELAGYDESTATTHLGTLPPDSMSQIVWSTIILVCLSYIVIVTPLEIALRLKTRWYDILIEVLFYVDIIFSFVLPYTNAYGITVYSPKMIRTRYVRTWLLLDIIAAWPVYAIPDATPMLKAFRLLRLIKLVGFKRRTLLNVFFAVARIGIPTVRLMRLLLSIVVVAHYAACLWFFIGDASEEGDPEAANRWTARVWGEDNLVLYDTRQRQYLISLYWAITTLSTVGYGDVTPRNTSEMILAVCVMLAGTVFFAYASGTIASLATSLDQRLSAVSEERDELQRWMRNVALPPRERQMTLHQFGKAWAHLVERGRVDPALWTRYRRGMTPELQTAVARHLYKDMVADSRFLSSMDDKYPMFIDEVLPALEERVFEPGEIVCAAGSVPTHWYVVASGSVVALRPAGAVSVLEAGGGGGAALPKTEAGHAAAPGTPAAAAVDHPAQVAAKLKTKRLLVYRRCVRGDTIGDVAQLVLGYSPATFVCSGGNTDPTGSVHLSGATGGRVTLLAIPMEKFLGVVARVDGGDGGSRSRPQQTESGERISCLRWLTARAQLRLHLYREKEKHDAVQVRVRQAKRQLSMRVAEVKRQAQALGQGGGTGAAPPPYPHQTDASGSERRRRARGLVRNPTPHRQAHFDDDDGAAMHM